MTAEAQGLMGLSEKEEVGDSLSELSSVAPPRP
jgi:hypothetical protein